MSKYLSTVCCAPTDEEQKNEKFQTEAEQGLVDNFEGITGTIGIALTYLAIIGYVSFAAPNQTPFRDQLFVMKAINMDVEVALNPVFYSIFFIMGIFPWIFLCLLIPSAKSRNGVPYWPFFALSNFFGAFAILPYFALWDGTPANVNCPPTPKDLEGNGNVLMRLSESRVTAYIILLSSLGLFGYAGFGGMTAFLSYVKLFDESKLVHVTSIDFLLCCSLAPFWMEHDAKMRKWEDRDKWITFLSLLPYFGPVTYLILRPRSGDIAANDDVKATATNES